MRYKLRTANLSLEKMGRWEIRLLLIYISIIFFSCNKGELHDNVKGSWYNINKEEKTYQEIHIDDSIFIYCYNNCDLLLTFNYSIKNDSIYLFFDKNNIEYMYQILLDKSNKKEISLINKKEKLTFNKMDKTYKNLNDFLVDYESLDSLSKDYFNRRHVILNSLKDTLIDVSKK